MSPLITVQNLTMGLNKYLGSALCVLQNEVIKLLGKAAPLWRNKSVVIVA